jgi:putative peptidoglycan lipid II flippase
MDKKSIIKKTVGVGVSTLASRLLGVVREVMQAQYLGVNAMSDAFATAFRIPNSFRKVFVEGALSASLVPPFVKAIRNDQKKMVDSLILLALLIFEGIVLLCCGLFIWKADVVIRFLCPGFSVEQIARTVPMLRILMPFILLISCSAVFGSALQAINHFFIPAITPAFINVVWIGGLALCMVNDLPINFFCYSIIFAGIIQLIVHIVAYLRLDFAFAKVTPETWNIFKPIALNVFFCIICVGMTSEISLIIDTMFASYLPAGSISLMTYAIRFMGIPLGLFASALSTITLPYFSRVSSYAPKRLSFFMVETSKLVFWVTIPMMLILGFLSEKLFHTIFLSSKFTMTQVLEARLIFIAFLVGLFSLSLNKILLNLYYSRHVMWLPAVISVFGAGINVVFNMLLISKFQAVGLALGTSIAACVQTLLHLIFLRVWFGYTFYMNNFMRFAGRYCLQLVIVLPISLFTYYGITYVISMLPYSLAQFFLYKIGFWLWAGPLCLAIAGLIYLTRKQFGIKLYFFD